LHAYRVKERDKSILLEGRGRRAAKESFGKPKKRKLMGGLPGKWGERKKAAKQKRQTEGSLGPAPEDAGTILKQSKRKREDARITREGKKWLGVGLWRRAWRRRVRS